MRFATPRLLWAALQVVTTQRRALTLQDGVIQRLQADCAAAELAYMRISRDLIEQFLIALDQPERNDEFRARLDQSLSFYRDEIAVREEHVR